jgi:hypothetical protein
MAISLKRAPYLWKISDTVNNPLISYIYKNETIKIPLLFKKLSPHKYSTKNVPHFQFQLQTNIQYCMVTTLN